MKKILIITTVPMSLATLIKGQPKYLSKYFEVKLVTSYSNKNDEISKYEGLEIKSIEMTRKITPFRDLKAMLQIFMYIRKEKPDIVYTFTPKAGLLGMMASYFAMVPVRIHNVVGMPLMEAIGKKKSLLKLIEKLTYSFSTKLFCNSFGLKKYINNNLTKKNVKVIANGSVNGVDINYFKDTYNKVEKENIRKKYNLCSDDFVLTFIGRIVKDKGVNELVESFVDLSKTNTNLKLLLVGDYEENLNPIKEVNLEIINSLDSIITVGFQNDVREFLAISDLFVLPSYREGLPNVLIEAGSYGVPLIATDINGCNEVIIENKTGLLVNMKSVSSLKNAIELLINDTILYEGMKNRIREETIRRYSQEYFWNELRLEFENNRID